MVNIKTLTIFTLVLVASLAISETFACRDLIQTIRRQRLRRLLQSDPDLIQEFGIQNPNGQNSFQGSSPFNQGFRNNMANPNMMGQNQQQLPGQQQLNPLNQMQQGSLQGGGGGQQQVPGQQMQNPSGQQMQNPSGQQGSTQGGGGQQQAP